jgi:predicted nuclease of predicted toxin-antitoxin system
VKILVDMNLSPDWCALLNAHGWEAVHWSKTGRPTATDKDVMSWAAQEKYVVFSHDLDFSAMLAASQASAPSIIQVRAQDTMATDFQDHVLDALRRFEPDLEAGAIVVVEQHRARVRILPLPVTK